jgi:NADPH:quinone reductase-like Zn-dependent oxidoreductase
MEFPSHERIFGYEAAGVVQRIGPDVKNLAIGDRVVVMAFGTFTTDLITTEILCEKFPDNMSFVDGASMPSVFATAIYSLVDIARLQEGQVSTTDKFTVLQGG